MNIWNIQLVDSRTFPVSHSRKLLSIMNVNNTSNQVCIPEEFLFEYTDSSIRIFK